MLHLASTCLRPAGSCCSLLLVLDVRIPAGAVAGSTPLHPACRPAALDSPLLGRAALSNVVRRLPLMRLLQMLLQCLLGCCPQARHFPAGPPDRLASLRDHNEREQPGRGVRRRHSVQVCGTPCTSLWHVPSLQHVAAHEAHPNLPAAARIVAQAEREERVGATVGCFQHSNKPLPIAVLDLYGS